MSGNGARAELLVSEKAHTRAGDALAAARRRLPMTRMEPVMVVGPDGPVRLPDAFEDRRMLIVYHFMWNQGAPQHQQCEGCTHSQTAMNEAVRAYLAERGVSYAVFSRNLASELGPFGVRVVNIRSAGSPDSRVFREAVEQGGERGAAFMQKVRDDTMLKELPSMSDIANVAVFLSSRMAAKITGVTVDVTSGTTTALNARVAPIAFVQR